MASWSSSSSAGNPVMAEQTNNQTGPYHHQPLQCPRCNSSSTKFCYCNNYSLSQPRHFCKSCKHYWTRGGTLRNVPVGGGCRKKKRLKGISSDASAATEATNPKIDLSPVSDRINSNPLFHSFPTSNNLLELNFPFSSFSSTRVCDNSTAGFNIQTQFNNLELGFSSGLMANEVPKAANNSIFFGSSDFSSSSTKPSLLASCFQQQIFGAVNGNLKNMINEAGNGGLGLMPYEETRMIKSENGSVMGKDVKFRLGENRFGWNPNPNPNPFERPINYSDPSSLIWKTNNLGAWFEPSNSSMEYSITNPNLTHANPNPTHAKTHPGNPNPNHADGPYTPCMQAEVEIGGFRDKTDHPTTSKHDPSATALKQLPNPHEPSRVNEPRRETRDRRTPAWQKDYVL